MPVQIGTPRESSFDQPFGLLTDCHRRIEMFLGALARVAAQSGGAELNATQRDGLENALRYFREAAPKHTADEEQSLFPRLRPVADPETLAVLENLEADHENADRRHRRVDELAVEWLSENRLGADDFRELREAIQALSDLYRHHIAVEDNTLFPAAARLIEPAAQAEIGREMATRRRQRSCS